MLLFDITAENTMLGYVPEMGEDEHEMTLLIQEM